MRKVKAYLRMKRNLKIFSFIAIFLFVGYILALQVFAADGRFVLSPDQTQYSNGDEVGVEIIVQTDKDWNSAGLTLKYDTNVYDASETAFEKELRDENGDKLSRSIANKFTVQDIGDAGKVSIAVAYIDSSDTEATYTGTVSLGVLWFKIKNNASGNPKIQVIETENGEARTFLRKGDGDYSFESPDLDVPLGAPLESHGIDKESISLDITDKKTDTITVNYAPANTSAEKGITFASADPTIARVTQDGDSATITAVGPGTTTITVTEFGDTHQVPVTVTAKLKSIRLNKTSLELTKNGSEALEVLYTPSNTTDAKTVEWTSSNTDAVTVNNGVVTAVGGGRSTVTATSTVDGSIIARCTVDVVIPLTNVSLVQDTFNLVKNDTVNLQVNYDPQDTTDSKVVNWVSGDTNVATVSKAGVVTAVGGGNTTITGTIGSFTLTAHVNVTVPITAFTTPKTTLNLVPNQTHQVQYTITPDDTTQSKVVSWSTTNADAATVNSDGLITAHNEGDATITGTLASGQSISISVHVIKTIQGIDLSQSEVTLYKGDSNRDHVKLTAIITPADTEQDTSINWVSTNPGIARVDRNGNVTAVSGGSTLITATLPNGMSATCSVTVEIAISQFNLTSNNSITVEKGKTSTITYEIKPTDATENRNVTWRSNNDLIATVDSNGKVKGVGGGNTTVTGTLANGMSITVAVNVTVPISGVTISGSDTITMNRGDHRILSAEVAPNDTTEDKTIRWKSNKPAIVSVDQDGKITAIGKGTVIITAEAGNKSDTVTVNVKAPIISFDVESNNIEVVKGRSTMIYPVINPSDTTDSTTITWQSNDETIATVDNTGRVVGKKAGNTTVTGTLSNGMSVTVNVKVIIIPVESISIDKTSLNIKKGDSTTLNVVVNPTDSTEITDPEWESGDSTIATVDATGKVTGKKAGSTTIKATMGDKEASIPVVVREVPLEEIAVANLEKKVEVDRPLQLVITENPGNPDGTTDEVTYTYESSDETIATVDAQGVVKGVSKGKATITVRSSNGLETTVEIEVIEARAPLSPNTGVPFLFVYLLSAFISLAGILHIVSQKKRHN